jgi:23S rRNA-/tRNA-specific pseudouridylate synthase
MKDPAPKQTVVLPCVFDGRYGLWSGTHNRWMHKKLCKTAHEAALHAFELGFTLPKTFPNE